MGKFAPGTKLREGVFGRACFEGETRALSYKSRQRNTLAAGIASRRQHLLLLVAFVFCFVRALAGYALSGEEVSVDAHRGRAERRALGLLGPLRTSRVLESWFRENGAHSDG